MAQVITKQKSLNRKAIVYISIGLGLFIISNFLKNHIYVFVLFLFPIAGLAIMGRAFPYIWGAIGEWRVSKIIENSFKERSWFIFNDLKIIGAQIDHVLICPKGVFTIETKNYTGKVYGGEKRDKWDVYLGGKKFKLYNPIKQGKKHSMVLSKVLKEIGAGDFFVKTIVVFAFRRAKLKLSYSKIPVLFADQLPDYLAKQQTVFGEEKCLKITEYLEGYLNRTLVQ